MVTLVQGVGLRVFYENMWFLVQDILRCIVNTIKNHANHPILKSMLKMFSIFVFKFGYECNKYLIVCGFSLGVFIEIYTLRCQI